MYYAIVSFGGSVPGPKVFDTEAEATAHLIQVERDTTCNGDLWCDPAVLHRARVNEYYTRAAAESADISDTTCHVGRAPTPGFRRSIVLRG